MQEHLHIHFPRILTDHRVGVIQIKGGGIRLFHGPSDPCFAHHFVERICDHAALLDQGRIVVGGTLAEIKALHGHESLLLEFPTDEALHTFKIQEAIHPLLDTAETNGRELVLHSQEMEKVQHTVFRVLAVAAVLMTVCHWAGSLAAYCYTAYLWPDTVLPNVFTAAFYLWLIGFLYLSILLLGCVIFKQAFTSILFTGGIVAVISLLGIAPPLARFDPFLLASKNVDLISGAASVSEFFIPAIISVVITVVGLWSAVVLFDRKQL